MSLMSWIMFLVYFSFFPVKSQRFEIVTAVGCESCLLLLKCRLHEIIAILNVEFDGEENILPFENSTVPAASAAAVHPRDVLNYRCSGMSHCTFELVQDCPAATSWGTGNVTVEYACIKEASVHKYCKETIVLPWPNTNGISEGFIHNPGYPRVYAGHECDWTIKAPPKQLIQLTINDISLNVEPSDLSTSDHDDVDVDVDECLTDVLEIIESDQVIYRTCRQQHPPTTVTSTSDSLQIVLRGTTNGIVPRRGVLIHYKAIGCPTPDPPEDGYLISRNDSVAQFRCCVGYRFPDSGLTLRTVRCLGAEWNESLPLINCERIVDSLSKNVDRVEIERKAMGSDYIAPLLLILALFVINGFVLFYIYRIRKRSECEVREEELGTLTGGVTHNVQSTRPR